MDEERAEFEDRVFMRRFLGSITHKPERHIMPFVSEGCPTKEELLRRKPDGEYEDSIVSAMWWAWKEAKGLN